MMIKEGTGNGTLVKNEQEFWIKAPPPSKPCTTSTS